MGEGKGVCETSPVDLRIRIKGALDVKPCIAFNVKLGMMDHSGPGRELTCSQMGQGTRRSVWTSKFHTFICQVFLTMGVQDGPPAGPAICTLMHYMHSRTDAYYSLYWPVDPSPLAQLRRDLALV